MRQALGFVRRHLLLVGVIVLAAGGTAYAASRSGSDDLKGTRFVENSKTIKEGQIKNVKANCRSGELILDVGYSLGSETASQPNPTVLAFGGEQRKGQGRFPDQAVITVGNITGGQEFEATVTGWCLKQ